MPNAYVYNAREYGNMLMCLGEARGNASHALRIYRERFPTARHPADSRLITAAFQRVLENRPIALVAAGGGIRERLNELFDDRWIGRLGPHAWPPRSPDLTPLDFFLWGYVKERVFNRECDSADEMRQRIVDVFDKLRTDCVEDHTMMPRLHEEMQNRAQICLEMNGAQFEPHLIRPRRI
ncbi:unnamed protein product [Parnassius mnemosyne]|uniref:DUF4817 domain-containing protein n=1 Tax=Parnassius mnemosyne TaxID=213953 RepID=A0AAV1LJV1_9NEOP